jgi:hypothetical protein
VGEGERLAFPHPHSFKRAALLVDRIYVPCWAAPSHLEQIPIDMTFGDPLLDQETFDKTWMLAEVDWPWKLDDDQKKHDELLTYFLREPLLRYRNRFPRTNLFPMDYDVGSPVIPVGQAAVYEGVLNNVPAVVEEKLTWPQIVEFRQDADARRQYRDLHLWLESGLKVESARQAEDLIAQKLDDYRRAIRKHGLKTAVEGAASLVSLTAIIPSAGGLVSAAALANPMAGAVVGGVLAAVGASAWVAKRFIEFEDVKRGQNREVAYLYEIGKALE